MLTLDKIYHAAFVLKDVARRTDLIEAPKLSKDCHLYLKTENLQVTGSFKVRGAYYKISQLSGEESEKGVIACSAGNHAQGVALAATRRGIRSIVCMPDGAPIMKVENTKSLGAEVCLVPGTYDDAHDKAVELQAETGMTFIHPYDDEQVIAGQGTIGLEILDQLPDLDAVIVPVGGGGLISGVAFAIKSLRPEVKVYGVQAEGAPSMYRSLHEHKYQTLKNAATFADGIQVKTPGELTYQLCEEYVAAINEGHFAFSISEENKIVAEYDINSLTSFKQPKDETYRKNRVIRVLDTFQESVQLNFPPNKYANSATGWDIMEGVGKSILKQFEDVGAITNVDYDADFLVDRTASYGDKTYFDVNLQPVDSAEKLFFTVHTH